MFLIVESCIFENDITHSNSISVVVFAGKVVFAGSDTILNHVMKNKSMTHSHVFFEAQDKNTCHWDEGKEVIVVKFSA